MKRKNYVLISDLPEYIEQLKHLMKLKGYSDATIRMANSVWRDILDFSSNNLSQEFNEEFCQKYYDKCSSLESNSDLPFYRATRYTYLLFDYIQFGVIFRINCTPKETFNKEYISLFESFIDDERKRNLSSQTMKIIRSRLFRLQDYLIDTGAKNFNEVTQEQINDYVLSMAHYSSTYTSESLRILKRLSDFSFKNGYCQILFSDSIPMVKNIRQQKLPSIFYEDEIRKIESVIDRSNPIGKRDYAIFILAARLGIRSSDIRKLKLSDINWDTKELSFTQYKTGIPIYLPLPDDVGWAIIDYLKNGRPESEVKNIFIAHRNPFEELSTVSSIIPKYLRKAKIQYPSNKRIGLHALRHGLATRMLDNDISLPVISQTLGHSDIESTEVYLRISISQLAKCGLEVEL